MFGRLSVYTLPHHSGESTEVIPAFRVEVQDFLEV